MLLIGVFIKPGMNYFCFIKFFVVGTLISCLSNNVHGQEAEGLWNKIKLDKGFAIKNGSISLNNDSIGFGNLFSAELSVGLQLYDGKHGRVGFYTGIELGSAKIILNDVIRNGPVVNVPVGIEILYNQANSMSIYNRLFGSFTIKDQALHDKYSNIGVEVGLMFSNLSSGNKNLKAALFIKLASTTGLILDASTNRSVTLIGIRFMN